MDTDLRTIGILVGVASALVGFVTACRQFGAGRMIKSFVALSVFSTGLWFFAESKGWTTAVRDFSWNAVETWVKNLDRKPTATA